MSIPYFKALINKYHCQGIKLQNECIRTYKLYTTVERHYNNINNSNNVLSAITFSLIFKYKMKTKGIREKNIEKNKKNVLRF